MCEVCKDCKEIGSKNDTGAIRRTFVFLVFLSLTLSALGISCFALMTVQNLSHDLDALRLVLRRNTVETPKQHSYGFINNVEKTNLATGPIYETPKDLRTANTPTPQRWRRSFESDPLNIELDITNIATKTTSEADSRSSTFPSSETSPASTSSIYRLVSNEKASTELEETLSEIQSTTEFLSYKSVHEESSLLTGNEKLIATTKSAQRTFGNPLKKDVETFNPRENNATEIPNENHNLSLSTKPNIPSIIEDVESPLIHIIQKKNVNYDADDVESFTPEYNVPHNAHKHRQRGRNGNQLEIIDEFSPQAGRLKSLIAVHLNGDTSQYMMGVHTNYRGNGHLRHAQKTFVDWKMSDWVETISASNSFHMRNGVLTVKESGLYFIYAQIYYLDEHDSNGFIVRRNSENLLQCKVTAPSSERQLKGNTCYTGGVMYLESNDRISLDDISDGRFTLFVPGNSFFGMIKLGDIKG